MRMFEDMEVIVPKESYKEARELVKQLSENPQSTCCVVIAGRRAKSKRYYDELYREWINRGRWMFNKKRLSVDCCMETRVRTFVGRQHITSISNAPCRTMTVIFKNDSNFWNCHTLLSPEKLQIFLLLFIIFLLKYKK